MPASATPGQTELLSRAWSELSAGRWEVAHELGLQALAASPEEAQALHILALALWGQGRIPAAIERLTSSVALVPDDPHRLSDLGVLRFLHEDWAGAAASFRESLRLLPGQRTALRGYAESLVRLGRYPEARRACEEWTRAAPGRAAPLRTLAVCLAFEDRNEEAVRTAEECLNLDPQSEITLLLMAAIRRKQTRFSLAFVLTREAARLHPESYRAQARLAVAHWEIGNLDGALAARERALTLPPADRDLAANLDWLALHDPAQTASSLLEIHRSSAAAWSGPAPASRYHSNNRDPERRLRVGYLSGEFVFNPAYRFLAPFLQAHDPEHVKTIFYMSRAQQDANSEHYKGMAGQWRDVWYLSDDALARQIRADGVDILVDLSGHFEHNRLGVFARRPAPVQVGFPHYPSTTGLDSIDYILTDIWTTPPGCESEYAEQVCRLPTGYIVYQILDDAAPVTGLPVLSNGCVTFGLFQRPGKLHAKLWDAITAVLRRVAKSRLLIHYNSVELDEEGSPQRTRLMAPLEARGVPASRVIFRGARPTPEHLAVVAEADIALDTFPYNGQTTTCDCLWMGVPVVSLRGTTHVSRVTPGILERMELGRLIGESIEDYVRIAAGLAGDLEALARLRAGLRQSMHAHSLTDGVRLAREIEAAYREMWRRWCAGGVTPTQS